MGLEKEHECQCEECQTRVREIRRVTLPSVEEGLWRTGSGIELCKSGIVDFFDEVSTGCAITIVLTEEKVENSYRVEVARAGCYYFLLIDEGKSEQGELTARLIYPRFGKWIGDSRVWLSIEQDEV
jgi:hypothetical protein